MATQIKETIDELNRVKPFDIGQKALARVCYALAQNIDAGNMKGRAIANEASQLVTMLNTLQGLDEVTPTGDLTPELLELLQVLQTAPTV